jgi:hypothetical protein
MLLVPCLLVAGQVPEFFWPRSITPTYTPKAVPGASVLLWIPSVYTPNTFLVTSHYIISFKIPSVLELPAWPSERQGLSEHRVRCE